MPKERAEAVAELAAVPALAAVIKTCGNCDHYNPLPKKPEVGQCTRACPTALAAVSMLTMEKNPVTGQEAGMLRIVHIDGYFPPTRADLKCGEWALRETTAPNNMTANSTTVGAA